MTLDIPQKGFYTRFPDNEVMSHIVDTLRKRQKLFVLGVALAVITLYMVPVDQLVQGAFNIPQLQSASEAD